MFHARVRPGDHTGPVSAPPAPGYVVPTLRAPRRVIGARQFDFDRQVAVMAIVNRTPDSFYDGGRTFALDAAVAAALRAADEGADWVDIGGVPYGRGPEVGVEEELDRVLPVVRRVADASDVVISVDTHVAEVARAVIAAGAAVVNDSSGLYDPEMAAVVADSAATLVLTHSAAPPRSEPSRPEYGDVVAEVVAFLRARVETALAAGVGPERLVVDPGPDLNKNTYHSLELTRRFAEVAAIGLPTLAAISNKDFVGETLDRPKSERLAGSLAAMVFAISQGARVVRVHEVAPSVDAVRMTEAILGLRPPAYAVHNLG